MMTPEEWDKYSEETTKKALANFDKLFGDSDDESEKEDDEHGKV